MVCDSGGARAEGEMFARHGAATWTLTCACDSRYLGYTRVAAANATAGSAWLVGEGEADASATLGRAGGVLGDAFALSSCERVDVLELQAGHLAAATQEQGRGGVPRRARQRPRCNINDCCCCCSCGATSGLVLHHLDPCPYPDAGLQLAYACPLHDRREVANMHCLERIESR